MNGTPPAYGSRQMIAMTAYITALSRGIAITAPRTPTAHMELPNLGGDAAAGAPLFSTKCALCHGANGAGSSSFPPLWGPHSFNDGAGMARVTKMVPFVRTYMPLNAPGSLSLRQAADVSAYVLSHARPHFNPTSIVRFAGMPAGSI